MCKEAENKYIDSVHNYYKENSNNTELNHKLRSATRISLHDYCKEKMRKDDYTQKDISIICDFFKIDDIDNLKLKVFNILNNAERGSKFSAASHFLKNYDNSNEKREYTLKVVNFVSWLIGYDQRPYGVSIQNDTNYEKKNIDIIKNNTFKTDYNSISHTGINFNSLKIALVDIKEYQMEGSISKDELVTDILKTNIEEVYVEKNRNIIIDHYSYSDYKKIKDDNINYDLIIKGRSSYVDNERISRIQFQATRKNSDLETDYNKNIDSIYKIDKFCFLGEGRLPANINFITKWLLALDYYFKEELTKCLPLVLELENMLSADKQDTFKDIDIGHVEVQFLKAVIFMLQDQQYDALEIFNDIEANHMNYLKNNSHILSKLHHNIGILEKVKGNLKVAVKHFENAISSKENQWQSYWELARITAYKKKKENTYNIIIKKDYQHYYTKAFEYSGLNHIKEELELINKDDFKIINTIKDYINETSINRNNKDIIIKGKE